MVVQAGAVGRPVRLSLPTGKAAYGEQQARLAHAWESTRQSTGAAIRQARECVACKHRAQKASAVFAKDSDHMVRSLCRALPAEGSKRMHLLRMLVFALVPLALAACYTASHAGITTDSRGLETSCASGCAEFRGDGTGYARFQKGTSQACAAYLTQVCAVAQKQCSNK